MKRTPDAEDVHPHTEKNRKRHCSCTLREGRPRRRPRASTPEKDRTEDNRPDPNEQEERSHDVDNNPVLNSVPQEDELNHGLTTLRVHATRQTTCWQLAGSCHGSSDRAERTGSKPERLLNTATTAGQRSFQSCAQRYQPSEGCRKRGTPNLQPHKVHGDNNDLTNDVTWLTAKEGLKWDSMESDFARSKLKQSRRPTIAITTTTPTEPTATKLSTRKNGADDGDDHHHTLRMLSQITENSPPDQNQQTPCSNGTS